MISVYLCIEECFVNGRRYVPNNPKKNIGTFKGVENHPCFKGSSSIPEQPVVDDAKTLVELAPPLAFQKKVTPEMEAGMKAMREEGLPYQKIADKFEVSTATVMKYTKGG